MSVSEINDLRSAGERWGSPEEQLERARAIAWHALGRRARSEVELRGILAAKRVDPTDADTVLEELIKGRYVDDAAFATAFAEDRRRLDDWGSDRIARRLRALGVAPEEIEAAVDQRDHEDEIEAATALLTRRVPEPPRTAREFERALGILVRKGFEPELARNVLRRYSSADSAG